MVIIRSLVDHFRTLSTTNQQMTEPPSHGSRYQASQKNRTLDHPVLEQDKHTRPIESSHTFVVCADTQYGMINFNKEWEKEMEYSRLAIDVINNLSPRPLFCCVCGDLVDMVASLNIDESKGMTEEKCDKIQDKQNQDWKDIWDAVHPDIALVCICGNHDVGNLPTKRSIDRFKAAFGDDYLSWWANGTYNIVVNSNLFSNPTAAEDLYVEQLRWLEGRLKYAAQNNAGNIFVFGHHPWFLYKDDEQAEDLKGACPYPPEWGTVGTFKDGYFHIPPKYRKRVMELFKEYGVDAAFSGHFHQNLVSKSSFGMHMIVTSSLSMVFESTGVPKEFDEPRGKRGIRVVTVQADPQGGKGTFAHKFVITP